MTFFLPNLVSYIKHAVDGDFALDRMLIQNVIEFILTDMDARVRNHLRYPESKLMVTR